MNPLNLFTQTKIISPIIRTTCLLVFLFFHVVALWADVTLSTSTVAAGDVVQNADNHIVYILQVVITGSPEQMTNFSMVSSGNYTGSDVDRFRLWSNSTPNMSGATSLSFFNTSTGNSETVSFNTSVTLSTGTSYLLVTADIFSNAMDGNTVHFNGSTNAAVLTFTGSPVQTNSQTNAAGVQTIQAPDVTYSTEAVAAADIQQNSDDNLAYIMRLDVATFDVDMDNFFIISTGTYVNGDMNRFRLWRNSTPSLTGAIFIGTDGTSTGNGETVSFGITSSQDDFAIGTHYLLVTVDVEADGTDGNTIQFNGSSNPVAITYTTTPNVTNSQTNVAGVQTIQAPDVTYSTEAVAVADIQQNTDDNLAYIMRLDVATFDVDMDNFSIISTGTYVNGDMNRFRLWRNSTPSLTGAIFIGTDGTSTGNGETVSFGITSSQDDFAIGTHYLLVTVDVEADGTDGNTIQFNGSSNPVAITYTTTPNVTNSQTNVAGVQTIQAPDVTYSTEAVAAADIQQNTDDNLAYIMRLDVATFDVDMDNFSIISTGTYVNGDMNRFRLWRNSTPSLTGAIFIGTDGTSTGNGETVSFGITSSQDDFAIGTHYLLVTVDVEADGTDGNTIQFNGSSNPVAITYTTTPNVTNSQTNAAGVQTIKASDITYTSEAVAAANILEATTDNIAYILRMDVSTADVIMNTFSIVTTGTYDSDDLDLSRLWRNTSPSLSGATFIGNDGTSTGSGETFSFTVPSSVDDFAIGTHYLIITVNVDAAATQGNTLHFNGATNPAAPVFVTSPNVTDNQSNAAGVQTLGAPLPIELLDFNARIKGGLVELEWHTASENNNRGFAVQSSMDGRDWQDVGFIDGQGDTQQGHSYLFSHVPLTNGTWYYRLVQSDFDGLIDFSPVRSVEWNASQNRLELKVFPNPATTFLFLQLPETITQPVEVSLFNPTGKLVRRQMATTGQAMDLQGLAPGMYWVKAVVGKRVYTGKFSKF